jgi:hypothetical protein
MTGWKNRIPSHSYLNERHQVDRQASKTEAQRLDAECQLYTLLQRPISTYLHPAKKNEIKKGKEVVKGGSGCRGWPIN